MFIFFFNSLKKRKEVSLAVRISSFPSSGKAPIVGRSQRVVS